MIILLETIFEEIQYPFRDPRKYRTPEKLHITPEKLFYMLIDESERTFKRGQIVTATVTKVLENMVLCKLDNGLDATIYKDDLESKQDIQRGTDLRKMEIISVGAVITGRIDKIHN